MKLLARVLLLACALAASAVRAQTPLPAGELLLAGDALGAFALRTLPHATDAVKFETVDVSGPGFNRGWRVATLRDVAPMASIELRALNARAVARGDVAMLRFFARATEVSDESGAARVLVVVRRGSGDASSSYEGDFSLGREWQEILVPFTFRMDFPKDDAAVMLRFGFKRQTVEIGGVDVVYYGKKQDVAALPRTRFTYAGREPDAAWRKEALARIEKIRKGDLVIRVTDATGKPVPNAAVKLTQTKSAFQWGSALQMARIVQDTPDNLRYREKVLQLFNAASTENDLKWPMWNGEGGGPYGNYTRAQTLAGLRWLKQHDFHLRGHVLVWPGWRNLPNYVQALRGTSHEAAMQDLAIAHIREITRATRDILEEWDVLNEPYTNHDLMDTLGREVMPAWFKAAREELPAAALYFNDFSNHDATTDRAHVEHFEQTTRYLLDHGAPVTGLGLQAHFNNRPNAPANILAVLDRYEQEFHRPVRFTEFDVWTFDEELQADYTRDFLILAYSHPSVVGVQFWGFWENAHWRPPAAMYRSDWSEKPNAKVYQSLVLDQWRTRLAGATGKDGGFTARGFYGDYQVTAEVEGMRIEKTFSLKPGEPAPTIELRLAP